MRISIELDIQPDEVLLAAELLNTLRALTDHVKGSQPPRINNLREIFEKLISRLEDPAQADAVISEVTALVKSVEPGRETNTMQELIAAYEACVFSRELVMQNKSVVPFLLPLGKMPEPIKTKIRDDLIQKVMAHLTKRRTLDADRSTFFSHAEAFAVMVKMDFVSVDGAAQTMAKLVQKVDTRSAAVTMMGKTVELCLEQLLGKCDPQNLAAMLRALDSVTDEQFMYDKDWIFQYVRGTTSNGSALPAVAGQEALAPPSVFPVSSPSTTLGPLPGTSPGTVRSLTNIKSFFGHTQPLYSLVCDSKRNEVIGGGQGGLIIGWDSDGKPMHSLTAPMHYVCSLDIHPRADLLVCCGMEHEGETGMPPSLAVYDLNNSMACCGVLRHPAYSLITCVKCMPPEVDAFVAGATRGHPSTAIQEVVCYYDLSRVPRKGLDPSHIVSVDQMAPLITYAGHTHLVTCLATWPEMPHSFVSGAKDGEIKLWDTRQENEAGNFNKLFQAHKGMITGMDVCGNLLLTTGFEGNLGLWDLRKHGQNPVSTLMVDNTTAVKVACTGAPLPNIAAVSTFSNLFVVDFNNLSAPSSILASVVPSGDDQPTQYLDIKWGNGVLYGAGNLRVDGFQLG